MQKKTEVTLKDKVILSPVQSTGDCGYHVVIIGLFYLALKATNDDKIASVINSSQAIDKLLAAQPSFLKKCLEKPFTTNQECLLSYLDAMTASGFDQIDFNEILLNFTLQLKQIICDSEWLLARIKNEIKSGLWLETNRAWEKLPAFKKIMKNIRMKADELYEQAIAVKNHKSNDDLLFEILFQAQIEACEALSDEELIPAAKEVISHFYTEESPKAWLDDEFLKCLITHLLGSSDLMFKDNVKITGEGPSNNHWYIALPNDEHTQKFISLYKKGHHLELAIVLPETKVEITLSSYSTLFPPAPQSDTNAEPPNPETTLCHI